MHSMAFPVNNNKKKGISENKLTLVKEQFLNGDGSLPLVLLDHKEEMSH